MRVFTTSPFLVPEFKPNLKFISYESTFVRLAVGIAIVLSGEEPDQTCLRDSCDKFTRATGMANWRSQSGP